MNPTPPTAPAQWMKEAAREIYTANRDWVNDGVTLTTISIIDLIKKHAPVAPTPPDGKMAQLEKQRHELAMWRFLTPAISALTRERDQAIRERDLDLKEMRRFQADKIRDTHDLEALTKERDEARAEVATFKDKLTRIGMCVPGRILNPAAYNDDGSYDGHGGLAYSVDYLLEKVGEWSDVYDKLAADLAALRAERDRLRGALDGLLNNAAVIQTNQDPVFIDLQVRTPDYEAAYAALAATNHGASEPTPREAKTIMAIADGLEIEPQQRRWLRIEIAALLAQRDASVAELIQERDRANETVKIMYEKCAIYQRVLFGKNVDTVAVQEWEKVRKEVRDLRDQRDEARRETQVYKNSFDGANLTLKDILDQRDKAVQRVAALERPAAFRLCSKCNQEFELVGGYDNCGFTSNFQNCPLCGVRNDTWIHIPLDAERHRAANSIRATLSGTHSVPPVDREGEADAQCPHMNEYGDRMWKCLICKKEKP